MDGGGAPAASGGFIPVGTPQRHWTPVPAAPTPQGPAAPLPPAQPEARKPRGTIGWDILMGFDVGLMALNAVLMVFVYLFFVTTGEPIFSEGGDVDTSALVLTNIYNGLLYGIIPLIWVMGTRVDSWVGTWRYLGLVRPFPAIWHGFGYAALLAGSMYFILLGLDAIGFEFESTGGELRFSGLTWGLALVTALVAGFAEEIFFRGILQKWIGVWAQAGVFGLMHLANGWMAFVVTASIGLLFGFLVKRGRSLWLVIVAHAAYNMLLFSAVLLGGEGLVAGTAGLILR